MKEIQLTQGQVALVDDEDYGWLNQWKWCALWDSTGETYYAARAEYLGKVNGKHKYRTVYMHREILGLIPGQSDPVTGKKLTGDHKDHNTLDNRKVISLRSANQGQQEANKPMRSDNTTGFKGVTKHGNGFIARIQVNGERINLPTCATKEEAFELLVPVRKELHGEFARA
jgi:hypothetical protein